MNRIAPTIASRSRLLALLAVAGLIIILSPSSTLAATLFFRTGDLIVVTTTDYTSHGTYFIWESRNVKYRLEMCQHQATVNYPANGHVRFKYDPHINANSFAIVSEGQIFPFPMPTYQNGSPFIPGGAHLSVIPYAHNEVKLSAVPGGDDMAVEAKWTTLDGAPKQKKLTGRDEITAFYKHLKELIQTMPASSVPQYIDVFPGESLLVTKGNIRTIQTDLENLIKAWTMASMNANSSTPSAAPSPAPANPGSESDVESFVANGPQGEASFDFTKNGGVFTIKNGVDSFHTKWGRRSMYQVNAAAGMAGKIGGQSGLTTLPSLSAAKLMDYSKPSRVVGEGEVVVFRNAQGKYVAVKLMHVDDAVRGGSQNKLTIRWKVLQQ